MSSPVSSRRLANLVKESLQGSVLGGVVPGSVAGPAPCGSSHGRRRRRLNARGGNVSTNVVAQRNAQLTTLTSVLAS